MNASLAWRGTVVQVCFLLILGSIAWRYESFVGTIITILSAVGGALFAVRRNSTGDSTGGGDGTSFSIRPPAVLTMKEPRDPGQQRARIVNAMLIAGAIAAALITIHH